MLSRSVPSKSQATTSSGDTSDLNSAHSDTLKRSIDLGAHRIQSSVLNSLRGVFLFHRWIKCGTNESALSRRPSLRPPGAPLVVDHKSILDRPAQDSSPEHSVSLLRASLVAAICKPTLWPNWDIQTMALSRNKPRRAPRDPFLGHSFRGEAGPLHSYCSIICRTA